MRKLQRQSEDYDYDGPTQDPISAQLGLVADSNRWPKALFYLKSKSKKKQPRTQDPILAEPPIPDEPRIAFINSFIFWN